MSISYIILFIILILIFIYQCLFTNKYITVPNKYQYNIEFFKNKERSNTIIEDYKNTIISNDIEIKKNNDELIKLMDEKKKEMKMIIDNETKKNNIENKKYLNDELKKFKELAKTIKNKNFNPTKEKLKPIITKKKKKKNTPNSHIDKTKDQLVSII